MDNPESPRGGSRPPRKELQGPRPTPLKVRKDSHKIRKPPMAPPAAGPPQNNQLPPQQLPRQPVIIYTVSPKVIHTHPSEFMNLVQRLTGPDHATSSSSSYSIPQHPSYGTSSHVSGAISPAARLASVEMTKMHRGPKKYGGSTHQDIDVDQITSDGGGGADGGGEWVGRTTFFPAGILSPGPGSLPPISPNLFTPIFHEANNSNINVQQQHELSVVQHENRNYIEGNYLPSPFFASPGTMISPSSLDFLQRVLNS